MLHTTVAPVRLSDVTAALAFIAGDEWAPEIPPGTLIEIDPHMREPVANCLFLCRCDRRMRLVRCALASLGESCGAQRWRIEYGWARDHGMGDEAQPVRRARIGETVTDDVLRARLLGRVMRVIRAMGAGSLE